MTESSARGNWVSPLLLAVAFTAVGAALIAWPIVPHDTDLFYHLNFGRRIVASGSIPHGAWYSYVATQRAPVDYFWLSQLVFFVVHRAFGPVGLVALRALLFMALACVVTSLAARSELARANRTRAACVVALALLVVLERFSTVRPHMFSYLFLATAIACVERGGRSLYALVPLAVLWANLHGIEYPLLLLVLGGGFVERARNLRRPGPVRGQALALCVAGLCVLANPFGARLLPVPFTPLGLVGQAIFELQPVRWNELASFGVETLVPTSGALRAMILGLALVCAAASSARRSGGVRHLLWLGGGVYLLMHAERFGTEFALLALPTILGSSWLAELRAPLGPRVVRCVLLGLLAALATARICEVTRGPWAYPVAENFLPRGTAALLRAHAPGGRVLHHPNYAGYLEWTLGDRFKIGPDLQTPFLFPGERVLELSSAYAEPRALRAAAKQWRADYVLVPWTDAGRLEPAVSDAYAPVGFDDVVVAYAHRQRCASFVARFELRTLVPAKLERLLHAQLPSIEIGAADAELARLAKVDGRIAVVNAAQAVTAELRGAHARARTYARTAVALAPGQLEALRIAGEVSLAAGSAAEALSYFTRGLDRVISTGAPPLIRSGLAWGAARALAALGRAGETYALILPVFGELTSASVSAADLRLLAAAAGDAGEADAARTLAHLAAVRSFQTES